MTRAIVVLVSIAAGLFSVAGHAASIAESAHNLSATGPGRVRAAAESGICEFCHVSHRSNAVAALWARRNPSVSYVPYSSSTAIAKPGQPTGSSLLCLSCHDGTIALGERANRSTAIVMSGGNAYLPPGPGLTGTDLSDDHPISFQYSDTLAAQSGELRFPGSLGGNVRLDKNGELQCTGCHSAHDDRYGQFLREPNARSQLCLECHEKRGWQESSHNNSGASWDRRPPNPWPRGYYANVSDNGCRNCHVPHGAGGPRLLRQAEEERNCEACHNGHVANKDVMAAFSQFSAHPMSSTTLLHDPVESAVVETRHVECSDCHDPHFSGGTSLNGTPPNVRGVSLSGSEVMPSTRTYEICLRCHGDSPNQPSSKIPRQVSQSNIRLKIQPSNPSYHPVAAPGQNSEVPSLILPMTEMSEIDCIDCHNYSRSASAGGSGPEGPHGSEYEPILVRNYRTLDNTQESAGNYALCYQCHSRASILADQSFPEHSKHISGENTPCSVCHDPHGISSTQGNSVNNSHLINFDTSVVSPSPATGQMLFTDLGDRTGSCDLLCHGENHDGYDY